MMPYLRLIARFCQEKFSEIAIFLLTEGVIVLVLYLQNIDLAAFKVAFLLPTLIFVLYLSFACQRFIQLHQFLARTSVENLPYFPDTSLIGEDYQQLLIGLEQWHQEKYQELLKFDKDLLDLTRVWTHQMKVPIAALDLMAQTNNLTQSDVQHQLLELDNYLNILLSYLRLQNTSTDFRFETFDVADVTRDIIKKYANQFIMKNLSVRIEGSWRLTSDRKWLTVALEQIINNAVKYTKTGGVRIKFDESITIADTGIGILPEDLPRLFEHGFTGYNGRHHQKSTGLGLYLTKEILDKLELTVTMTSQVEQGTEVKIKKN
ncbi:Signal transduction histidine kinase [Lactococcus chungangensis CAU 28 = DSM 22330]|uniref:histidine kinase n=2 Tax=Pseudolactococcus chungangensis CAU 28 = DSM 22330 TaxID=1122154 RepID=A0A1K2H5T3_9LACT|nr:sensor histidine kinase [Lactococcus chungangensis]NCB82030.1 HAMP domain-containing histidine kinase [Bacilli bacterium]SFZ70680.1 Signal transduction histidine kinase [Lactococcus chungangensis CAU 28 = DSM 22330]